jgi:hypothetical protein
MSEDNEVKYRVPLFDGKNYGNWKFRMQNLLGELELLNSVEREYTTGLEVLAKDSQSVKKQKEVVLFEKRKQVRICHSQIIQRIADSECT